VESTPGRGSVCWLRLRVARQAEEARGEDAARPARRLNVLIIDDEAAVARSLKRHLGRHYDVTALSRAREALTLITSGQRFDAILCDVMMPEMSGPQFYEELEPLVPEQARRITFMTGGAFSEEARAFLASARALAREAARPAAPVAHPGGAGASALRWAPPQVCFFVSANERLMRSLSVGRSTSSSLLM